jgi:hypothetical protein
VIETVETVIKTVKAVIKTVKIVSIASRLCVGLPA